MQTPPSQMKGRKQPSNRWVLDTGPPQAQTGIEAVGDRALFVPEATCLSLRPNGAGW